MAKRLFSQPWENGHSESCSGKLRDELLDWEIFYTLREAQVLIESGRQHYNGSGSTARWAIGPRPRGDRVAAPCAFPALGARVGGIPELTSGWTNQWGQAITEYELGPKERGQRK
jgi:Integrase core domain